MLNKLHVRKGGWLYNNKKHPCPFVFPLLFLFSFLFQRLRKFLGQSSSPIGVSAKKLLSVFIWIVQPLPRPDVTLAGSSSESSLPGCYSWKERDAPWAQWTRGVPRTDRRWRTRDHPWGPLAMDLQFLRAGLTVEPSVGATMEARACTEEGEWQTGRGRLGKEKQHSNLVLGPTPAEKKLDVMANTCYLQFRSWSQKAKEWQLDGFKQEMGFPSTF